VQSLQTLDTAAPTATEYFPAPQLAQALAMEAPVVVRYLPAPQSVHATLPVNSLYFPAPHATHVPPSSPVNPGLQTQAVISVFAVNACPEFVVQSVHGAVPVAALYFEAAHAKHGPPSGPEYPAMQTQTLDALVDCEFAGQATHAPAADAPVAAENVPAPQSRHVAVVVAPVAAEYLPAPQSRHAAEPVLILYLPAPHAVHAPPSGPEKPAIHAQLVDTTLPLGDCELAGQSEHVAVDVAPTAAEYVLASQLVHATLPVTVLYFPAIHSVHVPPFTPVYPGLQRQESILVCNVSVFPEFDGQSSHVTPVVVYLPAVHSEHIVGPTTALYLPTSHAVHVPPSGPVYPALHWQLVKLLPLAENELSGQFIQVLEILYFPASHEMHASTSGAAVIREGHSIV